MGVDYQSMSARELQQACRDRGLATARDKDTMVARLTEADSKQGPLRAENEAVTADPADQALPVTDATPEVPAVWQERYPAGEHLADREHQANCAAVVAAAEAHGYQPMGGGYRVGTVDGQHVYEVHLCRGTS
jgi:hypothetical protein